MTEYGGSSYASQVSSDGPERQEAEVRQRFSSASYITSVAGILKFIIIILFLLSGILFLVSQKCPSVEGWYSWLFPTFSLLIALLSLALYSVFIFALAKTNLKLWATVDIVASLTAAVAAVVVSVLTLTKCTKGDPINLVPPPLGLVGALLLAANAAATYIMAKYQKVITEDNDYRYLSRRFIRRFTLEA